MRYQNPIDLARPVLFDDQTTRAFSLPPARRKSLYATKSGGSVNCDVLEFCAHGAGTHTESSRHVGEGPAVYQAAPAGPVTAQLVETRAPCIAIADLGRIESVLALVVKTFRTDADFSGSHPPYFAAEALQYIAQKGVRHLLTDLPSVDEESDHRVPAHHAFFAAGGLTITELCAMPDAAVPGGYMLVLHVPPFDSDAAPSRPVLFALHDAP